MPDKDFFDHQRAKTPKMRDHIWLRMKLIIKSDNKLNITFYLF